MPIANTNATQEVELGLQTILASPNAAGVAEACAPTVR
jgi:hypothetical protein